MTHKRRGERRTREAAPAPLHRALGQSEQVKVKVEEAARELGDVNAVLKEDADAGMPVPQVKRALDKSEAVEVKVQEAAEELVAVNDALTLEVSERDALERRLSQTDAALLKSRAAEEKAQQRALHDELTALPNATLFGDRVANAIDQARRHRWRLAVMFLDLDDFKRINDTHGHETGDRVLQHVAQCLRHIVRGGDTIARRGGDEFLVLMLEVQDDDSAMAFATKLRAHLAEDCEIDGTVLRAQVSVGVALFPDDGDSAPALQKAADTAMYTAKRGRLGVARYHLNGGTP